MTESQIAAWNRVRNAGTVNLIVGWLGVGVTVIALIISMILIIANYPIANGDSAADGTTPSWVFGLVVGLAFLIFFLPFAIVNIISGVKLRKQVKSYKGWLIYSIVAAGLGLTSFSTMIPAILQLVFAIIALSGSHVLDESIRAQKLTENK